MPRKTAAAVVATVSALDALDSVATQKTTEKKAIKSTMPVLMIEQAVVDDFVEQSGILKEAEVKVKALAGRITALFENVYRENAKTSFSKSYRCHGTRENSIRITQSDRFSVNGAEAELKAVYPPFTSHFEKERTVAVKDEVFADEVKLKAFMSKFTPEELKQYFDIGFKIKAKKGFDEVWAVLPKDQVDALRPYIRQAAPGITVE